jgi:hypothetical protein
MASPNEAFLSNVVVMKTIKKPLEFGTFWENLGIPKVGATSDIIKYYKETYVDFETPNDAALGRTLDPKGRGPQRRAEGAEFPHAGISQPAEYSLRLYQMGLEMDYTEEELSKNELVNQVQRKTQKLGNFFASDMNMMLGNTLTENWTGTASSIQAITLSSGAEWDGTGSDPIKNILDAQEKIEDRGDYQYNPTTLLMSKGALYDLKLWAAKNDYELGYNKPTGNPASLTIEGLTTQASNQVKRDFAIVADFANCGTVYEYEPIRSHKYFTDKDHVYHLQLMRSYNFAFTDPQAVCSIINVSA